MSYENAVLALLWAAAPAATITPLLYAITAPWMRSLYGYAFLASTTALALLVDLTLFFHVWEGHIEAKKAISLAVYALVVLAVWLKLITVARAQVLRRRP